MDCNNHRDSKELIDGGPDIPDDKRYGFRCTVCMYRIIVTKEEYDKLYEEEQSINFNKQCDQITDLIRSATNDDKEILKDFEEWWHLKRDGVDREKFPNALPTKAARNVERMIDAHTREVNQGGLEAMKIQLIENIVIGQRIKGGADVKKMKVVDLQAMIDAIGWSLFPNEWQIAPGEIIGFKEG